jgi:DNA-binding SARP family transcriptional activator
MELTFGLLGPLTVHNGHRLLPISAAKQRVILALLLLRSNHVVSTAELIDAIWDESPPVTARVTLQNYIRRLRRTFGSPGDLRIRTIDPGYQIDIDAHELDVNRFESLCGATRAEAENGRWAQASAQLRTALDLWRGEPLVDVPCRALSLDVVPRLNEAKFQATESWIEAELHLGRHTEFIGQLTQLATEHPFRERLHRLRMLALYRDGRQAEALAIYRCVRGDLLAELGAEPGRELQLLHQRMLAADPSLMRIAGRLTTVHDHPVVPVLPQLSLWQLPRNLPDLVGHAKEVRQLGDALREAGDTNAIPVCAIVGAGGVGKSALAVHVAHLSSDHFPDGQLYADLGGSTDNPVLTADILARFLRDLGGDDAPIPLDRQELAAHYRSQLVGRKVLIVLDDIWDADQVRDLLPGSRGCAVLTTSRDRLLDLDSVRMTNLDPLGPEESLELFSRIVGIQRVSVEQQNTTELLRICGGIPLAIRIAAVQLAVHPNRSIARFTRKLTNLRESLDEFRISGKTLRGTYQHSYDRLYAESGRGPLHPRRAFRLLSLFDGPEIGLDAAAALFDLPVSIVEGPLEHLSDVHLLSSPAPGRYRFNWLTRAYALQRAEAEDRQSERDEAVRRILSWYLVMSASAIKSLDAGVEPPTIRPRSVRAPFFASREVLQCWLRAERDNLVAAAEQARRSDIDGTLWQLPIVVRHLFGVFGEQLPDLVPSEPGGLAFADTWSMR